jgi:acyl dehydratase
VGRAADVCPRLVKPRAAPGSLGHPRFARVGADTRGVLGCGRFYEQERRPIPRLRIGETAARTRAVRDRDIALFTELTGDRNPLHYDHEAAARSRFGGIIVQGGVTSGLLNAVVAEKLPGPGSVFLHVDWAFKAPVKPGDEIKAEVEVLEARDDKPLTKLRTTITNQEGVIVLDGSALVWTEPL